MIVCCRIAELQTKLTLVTLRAFNMAFHGNGGFIQVMLAFSLEGYLGDHCTDTKVSHLIQ